MEKFSKWFTIMMCTCLLGVTASSCSEDDDEPVDINNNENNNVDNNSGNDDGSEISQQVSPSELVGHAYYYFESVHDGYSGKDETTEQTIKFTSVTQCSVSINKTEWIWNSGWKQEFSNKNQNCSYTVSGDKITIHKYPLYGVDIEFTYCGNYLLEWENVWTILY